MRKKDHAQAAKMIRSQMSWGATKDGPHPTVVQAFVEFFRDDSATFDESEFRKACHLNVTNRGNQ